ncbi:MAG: AsnC family protein [Candidatus Competibacteraceae bacterium]|nr:AsnC family protein [Candidatus Competibacteraceae bacterium]
MNAVAPLSYPLPAELDQRDRLLIAAVQSGLPLDAHPYARVAEQIGMTEAQVIARLGELLERGLIKRLGVVVRHHELGYRANAMVVWDIPDPRVEELARRLSTVHGVTLCYRRPRRPPHWPYNLFTMIHGRDRCTVESRVAQMVAELGLEAIPHQLLFSRRRFKQRGARFAGLARRD